MFATFAHSSFLMLMLAGIFIAMATGIVFALTQYFYTYIYLFSAREISNVQLSGIFSAALAFLIALPISRRYGKKWPAVALFATGLVLGSVPLFLWLLGLFPVSPSPITLPGVIAATIAAITLTTASSILLTSMLTDVVEDSEIRTGRRSEGAFFAASSFVQKSVSGLGLFLSGLVLWIADFPQHAMPGKVPHTALVRLSLIELSWVILLYGVALVCVAFYRITRADHAENLRRIAAEQALIQTPIGAEEAVVHAAPDSNAAAQTPP
jgi:Na+/melibiose symporter-like transporter